MSDNEIKLKVDEHEASLFLLRKQVEWLTLQVTMLNIETGNLEKRLQKLEEGKVITEETKSKE